MFLLCGLVINAVTGTDLSCGLSYKTAGMSWVIDPSWRTHQQFACCSNPCCSAPGQMEWANMLHVRGTPRKAGSVHLLWLNLFLVLLILTLICSTHLKEHQLTGKYFFLWKRIKTMGFLLNQVYVENLGSLLCSVAFVVLNVAKVWGESLPHLLPSACEHSATGCWCSLLLLFYFLLHRDMLRAVFHPVPPSQSFCSTPWVYQDVPCVGQLLFGSLHW